MNGAARLGPGATIAFDGEVWSVVGLSGAIVHLRSGLRSAAWLVADMVARPDFRVIADTDGTQTRSPDEAAAAAGDLDALPAEERATLARRLNLMLLIRDARLPNGPLDEELAKATTTERIEMLVAREGVGRRTLMRWWSDFKKDGPGGLLDRRARSGRTPTLDARWREAIVSVLDRYTDRSRVTDKKLLEEVRALVAKQFPDRDVPEVSDRTLRRHLDELGRGRGRNLSTKTQRSIANRPGGAWRRAFASRVGEIVAIDATPLDAYAMDPVTGKWASVHLLLALDLRSRSIVGWRFTPGDPTAVDASMLLRDMVTPRTAPVGWPVEGQWRYQGVPTTVAAGILESDPVLPGAAPGEEPNLLGVPCVVPDTVVLDHGKVFVSHTFRESCETLGVNLQFSRPYTPTDKAQVERVFKTIRTGFVERLPGFKGADVYSRGTVATVEDEAFLFIDEIADRFAAWVAVEYQNAPHKGLIIPDHPGVTLTPNQVVDIDMATAGYLPVPVSQDLLVELLPTHWRQVRPEGLEVNGLVYDLPTNSVLDEYRNRRSPYTSRGGKWRVKSDPRDLSHVWWYAFDNPDQPNPGEGTWVAIPVKGWPEGVPFTDRTLAYVKRLVRERGYSSRDRDAVVTELRRVLDAMEWGDQLTKEEKRLAARELFHRNDTQPTGARITVDPEWTDPDDTDDDFVDPAPTTQKPPASSRPHRTAPSGTSRQHTQTRKEAPYPEKVEPMPMEEVEEIDMFPRLTAADDDPPAGGG
ncbi:MAG: DDE-type integrase/transposase/recombinase [Actinomycetota bacterium]|nr:DDE-type integrase/transposase/recombinase [Actinomycetota bacterium]